MQRLDPAPEVLEEYEAAVAASDRPRVVALVDKMLDDGMAPLSVLTDVVATSQRVIGQRWQRGEWSVAQEHAATAMAMAATEVVARRAAEVPVTCGHVIVTCAEREWHWLPAAIIGCVLRTAGWQTTPLGPATSPLRLSQYIQDVGPEAVAISCSVLGSIPTTRRFIEASTSAGVPVVVGGPALGGDAVRAAALGATAWAADAVGALEAMDALPVVVSPVSPLPEAPAQEQGALELAHADLVDRVIRQWSVTADEASGPEQTALRAVARDAVPQTLHAVSAALLTGDPRPVSETALWTGELLAHRGVEVGPAIEEMGRVLGATLLDYPLSTGLISEHFRLG
ncbi:cobalamin B12-binding domain-containing protein [Mycolicibacterium confluentis]|uniref:Cobalamin-binding protein n=1 Tax=Mycolicibacterium confluentis TaxID=28047 RepID=A0A7I7Y4K0_9MYCO|nr:cobalamin B12-binding domain-containing protein [Mycolicibacterium confluentis]MCV7318989.1 cobalamin B12-binding domain-containing protein [Mycolicibacterium confluentis]BBZ36598.1 cobalamin-binding protein [Mycolicibacterium confluentis]